MSAATAITLPQTRPCAGCSGRDTGLRTQDTGLPFSPPPEAIPAILDDFSSPDITFRDVARMHGTNVDALAVWLARPEIAERVADIHTAIACRARIVATCFLTAAVKTVRRIIDEYNDEESHVPVHADNTRHAEYRRRSRETARRAASLLLRMAKFLPAATEPQARARGVAPPNSRASRPAAGVDDVASAPPGRREAVPSPPPAPDGAEDATSAPTLNQSRDREGTTPPDSTDRRGAQRTNGASPHLHFANSNFERSLPASARAPP